MSGKFVKLLDVTCEYGQGFHEMIKPKEEEITQLYDFTSTLKGNVLEYKIHEIKYTLGESQNVQTLTMVYKNRNDGHLETLLNTEKSATDAKEEIIEFDDNEEIVDVFFYVKEEGNTLAAFMIKTNLKPAKYIGNQDKGRLVKSRDLETGKKIVLGFGVNAGKKYGVSSIYCYYMDKSKFGILQYSGLLQLRAKLKLNPEFKKELEAKKESLNDKQKLMLSTCDLPDAAFFPVASYIMSV